MAKTFKPRATAIHGDMVFSKDDVQLFTSIKLVQFEFISNDLRERAAMNLSNSLIQLLDKVPGKKALEGHLISTTKPFDYENWHAKMNERVHRFDYRPSWDNYSLQMMRAVASYDFRVKTVYLGIRLGSRSEFGSTSNKDMVKSSYDFLKPVTNLTGRAFGIVNPSISFEEINFWEKRAAPYRYILEGSNFEGRPATNDEIATLIQEPYRPAMQTILPSQIEKQNWGAGEISSLATGEIQNYKKYLKMKNTSSSGEEEEGYRATLCITRFPDEMHLSSESPWMHRLGILPFSTSLFSRFTIQPIQKVLKDVAGMRKIAEDQAVNAGDRGGYDIHDQLEMADTVEERLKKTGIPWIYARHRIVVTASSEDELNKNVQETIERFKDLDIDVKWTSGDQLELMMESQPGDTTRCKDYNQYQEVNMISVGMPHASGSVGDRVDEKGKGYVGAYVGYTISRMVEPVFLSLHSCIVRDKPPALMITGKPGSGKTFTAFTIMSHLALQGVWTIFIDPKGDSENLEFLPGLEGHINMFDLSAEGTSGLLDPFRLSNKSSEQQLYAINTLETLLNDVRMSAATKAVIYEAVYAVSEQEYPSMNKVVRYIEARQETSDEARALTAQLRVLKNLDYANLCFGETDENTKTFSPEDGLTVISMSGLNLPEGSNKEEYDQSQLLAVCLMFLVTAYTRKLLFHENKAQPKAVIIDEAWALTKTPAGRGLIPALIRLGRSLNLGVIVISQNDQDFADLKQNISLRMAFQTDEPGEITSILESYDLDSKDRGNRDTIQSLDTGECLIKDADGRIAMMKIDGWSPEYNLAYETNPDARAAQKAMQQKMSAI